MQHSIYKGGQDSEIVQLFAQAFTDTEGKKEGALIGNLVHTLLKITPTQDIRVFTTSKEEKIVGGVIFSKMRFNQSTVNAWLLSPAAVVPSVQGTGVGQGLIQHAHQFLKNEGAQVLITYGDIRFYSKVGYKPISEQVIPAPLRLSYPEGWIAQSLEGKEINPIKGKSFCAEALNNSVYW
ncbi:GNAT family N-acetyltransferase [uncultured Microscilla sp.]|uniref:GNAT family N-acetyltransferase n=1 Tax=uncultured Microscilla sp. TaxID=432653 RepID=UPI0026066BF9|nr:N-acetyltransferase [uncultured Microscilla sp.]